MTFAAHISLCSGAEKKPLCRMSHPVRGESLFAGKFVTHLSSSILSDVAQTCYSAVCVFCHFIRGSSDSGGEKTICSTPALLFFVISECVCVCA